MLLNDAYTVLVSWRDASTDERLKLLRLAELARSAGCHGIVCSGQEAAAVFKRHGSALKLLVPGIRLPGDAPGDQARIVTPEIAAEAGASYLVLGRAITAAKDPRAAMAKVTESLERS